MCVVSAVMPQMQDGLFKYQQAYPTGDYRIGEIASQMQEVLQRLDRIDKALGLRDCKETEASKQAFFDKLDELSKAAKEL